MKLYNIPSAEKFFEKIMTCSGDAFIVNPSGENVNLKDMARSLMQTGMIRHLGGIDEINLLLTNNSDTIRMLDFAAGMHYGGRVA